MNKEETLQFINGHEFNVCVTQCNVKNRAAVVVQDLEDALVGSISIDHNQESTDVVYRAGPGEYIHGMYNYYHLPESGNYVELAGWLVNSHPYY